MMPRSRFLGLAAGLFVGFAGTRLPSAEAPDADRDAGRGPVAWMLEPVQGTASVPRITHVQVVDLYRDGKPGVLVCDAGRNAIHYLRRNGDSSWVTEVIADGLNVPAHATVTDLDQDGDLDIVVAILGDLLPSDEQVGAVLLLRSDGKSFSRHVLLGNLHRVADVQVGDLDGDGDPDLVVAVFGYAHGEVLWLEQRGPLRFARHHLLDRPGTIHVPVADFDGDGDLDIATVSSQDEEEVWGLVNMGSGRFEPRLLWFTHNFDAGSGGLVAVDLDRDGDQDLLLPLGDNLEHGYGWPQPYHGCLWLENQGAWQFKAHRIASFGGTYAVAPGDLDGDGDIDVVLVSMSNNWNVRTNPSAIWLENDGNQRFSPHPIASDPVELITVACGDLDADGRLDVVAGGLHLPGTPLHDRLRSLAFWRNRAGQDPANRSVPGRTASLRETLERPVAEALDRLRAGARMDHAADLLRLAEVHRAFGLLEDAGDYYALADRLSPLTGEELLGRASTLSRMGQWKEAAPHLRRLAEAGGESAAPARLLLARDALRADDPGAAEPLLRALPDSPEATALLARLLIRTDRAGEAARISDAWLRHAPTELRAHQMKSWAEARLGNSNAAAHHRFLALHLRDWLPRKDPVTLQDERIRDQFGSGGLVGAARRLEAEGKLDEAEARLGEAIHLAWNEDAALHRAGVQFSAGRRDDAIRSLGEIIHATGESAEILDLLGDARQASGFTQPALDEWQRAAEFRFSRRPFGNAAVHNKILQAMGTNAAPAVLRHHRAMARLELGRLALAHLDLPAAKIQFLQATGADPSLAAAWLLLGETCELQRDPAGARHAYSRGLDLDPLHGPARERLRALPPP